MSVVFTFLSNCFMFEWKIWIEAVLIFNCFIYKHIECRLAVVGYVLCLNAVFNSWSRFFNLWNIKILATWDISNNTFVLSFNEAFHFFNKDCLQAKVGDHLIWKFPQNQCKKHFQLANSNIIIQFEAELVIGSTTRKSVGFSCNFIQFRKRPNT